MDIHEYQAKELLCHYGIPIPKFAAISTIDELKKAMEELALDKAILKVQVHAGGRGKAGGVKFAKTPEEILSFGKQLLGMKIVNNQTGPEGIIARKILISDPVSIKKEYYLGIVIDRQNGSAMLIASPEGGMEIEEVAAKTPEKVLKMAIGNQGLLRQFQLLRIAKFMGWWGKVAQQGIQVVIAITKFFFDKDASLLEINPLVETTEGNIVALDAKLSVDDNALFRQPKINACYDPTQLTPSDARAKELDLAYIALEGNIGCMVNGAGLAMATMDIIHHYGAFPANFLDVGGGASKEKVAEGFKLILSDARVKAILVNIFGGIMNCETLASGIIEAANELDVHVPLIVRMEGTNVDKGKKLLHESGLNIVIADNLSDAAQKVVNSLEP